MDNNEFCLEEIQDAMKTVLESGGEFRFYPKGRSMLPLIRQGLDSISLVAVDGPLKKYDIPLYVRSNGQFVLHRVVGVDSDGYIMCGDNQLSLEHGILSNQIRARVCAIFRQNRRIDVTNPMYVLYCKIWCYIPFRRIILFVKRVFRKLFRR